MTRLKDYSSIKYYKMTNTEEKNDFVTQIFCHNNNHNKLSYYQWDFEWKYWSYELELHRSHNKLCDLYILKYDDDDFFCHTDQIWMEIA